MSKPSEFYIGVLDAFAVLLPGAIATAILAPTLGPLVVGPIIDAPRSDVGRWAIFLTCAYFIGHLIFLLGSWIDPVYNVVREWRHPHRHESAFKCATRIRDSLVDESERGALNTFLWCRSVLIAKNPAAADDVHRLEADSKFFRSLLVVCVLGFVVFLARGRAAESLGALVLVPLCFARYYERRLKTTTQAYIHVITMYRLGALTPAAPARPTAAAPGGPALDSHFSVS